MLVRSPAHNAFFPFVQINRPVRAPSQPHRPKEELPFCLLPLRHVSASQPYLSEVLHTGTASIGCSLLIQSTHTEPLLCVLWCAQHWGAAVDTNSCPCLPITGGGHPSAVSYLQDKGPGAASQSFSQCTTTCKAESKWLSWVVREVIGKRCALNREGPEGGRCCELSEPG